MLNVFNQPVLIKSREDFEKASEPIKEALRNASYSGSFCGGKIPLIYQYNHKPNEPIVVDEDNKIGEIDSIGITETGDIIGNVTIYHMKINAKEFDGVVDNILVSDHDKTNTYTYERRMIHQNKPMYKVDAFIIYNKEFKRNLRIVKELRSKNSIPFMSQIDAATMQTITDSVMEEFDKLVANKQEDNKNKEVIL